jgi:hypothetical protein
MYELPIELNKFKELNEVMKGNKTYCLFKLANDLYKDTLFVFAHGTDTGLIEINGIQITNKQLLTSLLTNTVIKERNIKTIYTICCHGGIQQPITIDDVTIKSMHDSVDTIRAHAFATVDEEYFLNVSC